MLLSPNSSPKYLICATSPISSRLTLKALHRNMELGYKDSTMSSYGLNGPGFESWDGQDILFFQKWFRLWLVPTQPPFKLVRGFLSLG